MNIYKDKVELSVVALIEIKRAFDVLKEDKDSYLHKVFIDDFVHGALSEIDKVYDNYFKTDEVD